MGNFLRRPKSRQNLSPPSPTPTSSPPSSLPSPTTNDFRVSLSIVAGDALTPAQPVPVQLSSPLNRYPSLSKQRVRAPIGVGVGSAGFHTRFAYKSNGGRSTPEQVSSGMVRSVSEPVSFDGRRTSLSSRHTSALPPPLPLPARDLPHLPPLHSGAPAGRRTIASLYPSPAFSSPMPQSRSLPSFPPSTSRSPHSASTSQPTSPGPRRARKQPPNYTILLAGLAPKTGKKSFARALDVLLPSAPRGRSDDYADELGVIRSSRDVLFPSSSPSVGGRKPALHLSLITTPTPSIPYASHTSLSTSAACDTHVTSLVRLLESQFETTLQGELEFSRTGGISKEDTHVHVCLWFVDPGTLRRETKGGAMRLAEEDEKAVSRLAKRVLVVPVIAKSDTLTLSQLRLAKSASLSYTLPSSSSSSSSSPTTAMDLFLGAPSSSFSSEYSTSPEPSSPSRLDFAEDSTRADTPRPLSASTSLIPPVVVHLKRAKSRQQQAPRCPLPSSAAKKGLKLEMANGKGEEEKRNDEEWSVERLREVWPFALVSAEFDEGGGQGGKLMREFRHGSIDLLNPEHCDFLPLFSSLFELERIERLKSFTRLSAYEPFRTERLLALRAHKRQERGVGGLGREGR